MSKKDLVEELHKPARKNYERRHVTLKGINDLFEADLVEMIPYAKSNNGMKYILMVINAFSKMGYAEPLKSKKGLEITAAFARILNRAKFLPKLLHTDRGKEFYNKDFSNLLSHHKIKHYSTYSDKKAAICERWNRTIKNKMWKIFSLRGNYKWVDILQQIIEEYNNTVHRTIRMKPIEVDASNEKHLLTSVYAPSAPKTTRALKVGDKVRISKAKALFEKGYLPNWSAEAFTITSIQPTTPNTYLLEDWEHNPIAGGFYREELLKTNFPEIYLVEKVLKRKKDILLVKWIGFKDPTWITKTDIVN